MTWLRWRPRLGTRILMVQLVGLFLLVVTCVGIGLVFRHTYGVHAFVQEDLEILEWVESIGWELRDIRETALQSGAEAEERFRMIQHLADQVNQAQDVVRRHQRLERRSAWWGYLDKPQPERRSAWPGFRATPRPARGEHAGTDGTIPALTDLSEIVRQLGELESVLQTLSSSAAATGDAAVAQAIGGSVERVLDQLNHFRRSELAEGRERIEQLVWLQHLVYRMLGLVLVLGLVGVTATMWYTSRMIISPILKLSGAAQAVGAGRDEVRVHIKTGDEIEQLAITFNRMIEQVQRSHQSLEKQVAARTALLEAQACELLKQREALAESGRQSEREKVAMVNLMEDLRQAHDRLKMTQAQLLQSGKLAAIGQLAAGVAHEINNPTGFVLSNLETIREYGRQLDELLAVYREVRDRLGAHPAAADAVERLIMAVDQADMPFLLGDLRKAVEESIDGMLRIKRIVQGLRTYARGDTGTLTQVDVHQEIDSAIQLAWNEIKHKAEVVKEYGELPMIWGYSQQLNQVFLNLLVNAAHAIDRMGEIRIRTSTARGQVVIEMSDTGCGMSDDIQRRIFEPFFTTKQVGQGTGLGLSIVYNIVQAHHGTIEVRSRVGQGTTFVITLPVEQPAAADRRSSLVTRAS